MIKMVDIETINIGCNAGHGMAEEEPKFSTYSPDMDKIQDLAEKYSFNNLVVIGNGGSVTSFRAFYQALEQTTDKEAYIVTTMDPDYLLELSEKLSPEDTLVMPISKSGETVGVIESLLYFVEKDFPVFAVTSDNEGALRQIVSERGFGFIKHPDISGRYSGATETGMVPAAFAGLDFRGIREGVEQSYKDYSPDKDTNRAKRMAQILYNAEISGYTEVFTPFYSERLKGFYPFLVQAMHETFCKEGRGQTFFGDTGPECQHHTIQRLFGGRENVLTWFFDLKEREGKSLKIGSDLLNVKVRGESLESFQGKELSESLKAEMEGVKQTLKEKNMPGTVLTVESITPENVGKLLGFIQYTAFYSAKIRNLNPFNQPNVERSKELGFQQRFKR